MKLHPFEIYCIKQHIFTTPNIIVYLDIHSLS